MIDCIFKIQEIIFHGLDVFLLFFSSPNRESSFSKIDFFINGGLIFLLTSLMYYSLATYERFKLDSFFIPRLYAHMPFFEVINSLEPSITIFLPFLLLLILVILSFFDSYENSDFPKSNIHNSSDYLGTRIYVLMITTGLLGFVTLFCSSLLKNSSDYFDYVYIPMLLAFSGFIFILFRALYIIDFNDRKSSNIDQKYLNVFDLRIFYFSLGLIFSFVLPCFLVLYTFIYQSNKGLDMLMISDSCTSGYFVESKKQKIASIKIQKKINNATTNEKKLKSEENKPYYVCKTIISENKDGYITWKNLYINKKEMLRINKDTSKLAEEKYLTIPIFFDNKIYSEEIKSTLSLKEVSFDWNIKFYKIGGIKSELFLRVYSPNNMDFIEQKRTKSIFQILDKNLKTN